MFYVGGCLRLELDFATLCFFKRLDDDGSSEKKCIGLVLSPSGVRPPPTHTQWFGDAGLGLTLYGLV